VDVGVLRELFGPSRDEIWQQLAHQIGGVFDPGGFLSSTKVRASYGEWIITLDTYTQSSGDSSSTYTRMRAPYVNRDGFRFTIYREGIFSGIGRALGMQDIEVGYPEFDNAFVIKGNSEAHLRTLFANERVRALISAQPDIHFEVKDGEGIFGSTFPDGVDMLYFRVCGEIRDIERLRALYDLFAEVLNQLCRIGSAYVGDSGIRL